jgi:hypothetical protein
MAYRNKTYVCFDGDTDMQYYRLMTAWTASDHSSFNFKNDHDLNTARDTSQEESIRDNCGLDSPTPNVLSCSLEKKRDR